MIRVLYAGSPKESAVTLKLLIESSGKSFEIAGVLTNPPSAQGRHKTPVPTPVETLAREKGIPVFTPQHLDADCRSQISAINAEILVCFAYGHIFGPKFLSLFKYGGINLHPSALPKYRGCTPVNAAILNADSSTAFTVQTLSLAMDEGDILCQKDVPLNGTETAGSLLLDAATSGAALIEQVLNQTDLNGILPQGKKQTGEASYTGIITKETAHINWNNSAKKVDSFVRAYTPEPSAWTLENNQPLKILSGIALDEEAINQLTKAGQLTVDGAVPGKVLSFVKQIGILVKCQSGVYAITKLQRQGKNPMDYKSFMNGAHNFVGTVFEL